MEGSIQFTIITYSEDGQLFFRKQASHGTTVDSIIKSCINGAGGLEGNIHQITESGPVLLAGDDTLVGGLLYEFRLNRLGLEKLKPMLLVTQQKRLQVEKAESELKTANVQLMRAQSKYKAHCDIIKRAERANNRAEMVENLAINRLIKGSVEANYRKVGKLCRGCIDKAHADIKYCDNCRVLDSAVISEGSTVEVNYRGRGRWYLGRVKQIHSDGTMDINYHDTSSEKHVSKDLVRLVSGDGRSSPCLPCREAEEVRRRVHFEEEEEVPVPVQPDPVSRSEDVHSDDAVKRSSDASSLGDSSLPNRQSCTSDMSDPVGGDAGLSVADIKEESKSESSNKYTNNTLPTSHVSCSQPLAAFTALPLRPELTRELAVLRIQTKYRRWLSMLTVYVPGHGVHHQPLAAERFHSEDQGQGPDLHQQEEGLRQEKASLEH